MPKSNQKSTQGHVLAGDWASADEHFSEVEYSISSKGTNFKVSAFDGYNGEAADISEVKWDGEVSGITAAQQAAMNASAARAQGLGVNIITNTF